MGDVILGVGLVGALIAVLVVMARRRNQRERQEVGLHRERERGEGPMKADPELVDRPYDPSLCAFCDEGRWVECRACGRPTCAEHQPWPVHAFCYPCEAEWQRGASRRAVIIVPIVIVTFSVIAGGVAYAGLIATGWLSIGALAIAVGAGASVAVTLERGMRRRFRPTGNLPRASATATRG